MTAEAPHSAARPDRYTTVAIVLHWTIALLIFGLFASGKYMVDLPLGSADQFALYQLHKSVGLSVLVLSVARVAWRLMHPAPPLPGGMKGWERAAAKAAHLAFYVLILAIPLAGWAMVSASPWNIPTIVFGVLPWPHLPVLPALDPAAKEAAEGALKAVHETLANLTVLLAIPHAAAALVHQYVRRDGVLARMIPVLRSRV